MFDLRFRNDPFALPTAMAAAMLAGIVGLGWRMNVVQRLTLPGMTATAQAAPTTPAMPPFRTRIASAAALPPAGHIAARPVTRPIAARPIAAHPAAARIAMQMQPVPAAPPALNVATARPATPPLAASMTALPRMAPVAARRASAPASAPASIRARLAMTTRPAPALGRSLPAPRPAVAAGAVPPSRWITVQPGQTLWQIAQQTYGNGDQYMRIFRANRAQLSRPDQIRPGQRLRLPMGPGRARLG
jgi:5'-nucleotidase/UDP-sugar diphosphatase